MFIGAKFINGHHFGPFEGFQRLHVFNLECGLVYCNKLVTIGG